MRQSDEPEHMFICGVSSAGPRFSVAFARWAIDQEREKHALK
jgi:hypothetical protein